MTGVQIKKLRDPTCDVICVSSIIQDGGQFATFSPKFSRIREDMKKPKKSLLDVSKVLSNATTKF